MMDDRGIKWACSRCGASFSTSAALTAHIAVEHGAHPSRKAPSHELARPSVSAGESEPSPRERGEPDADLERQSEPEAAAFAAGATPSVAAIACEPSSKELRQPDADLARQSEPDTAAVAADEKPTAAPTPQPLRRTAVSSTRKLRWVAFAATCLAAVGLGIAFHHQIARQIALAVTTQPTPYTELYFSEPQSLPASLSLSTPNPFSFTVVNHEGRDTVYSYVVTLASSYGSSTIAQGRIDLRNNMSDARLVNVRPTQSATEYVTTVSLQGRSETIRFRAVSK